MWSFGREALRKERETLGKTHICISEEGVMAGRSGEMLECE